ncbi:hypothetical protein ACVIHH_005128 [Bradyrhizobium sp. USDA 4518]|uniref:hypothetical protein n=1 Tax=Bradyrhizobium TaxID=374 RepID=UPI000B872967|nr:MULTISPECIES: hypothetical protein [Bradyrhizobium]MCC8969534.1 hypothetical protein [Bradyrhizobium brasilense]MCP1912898.1 hypothetical protein [Bradyrhizobium elkanii]
MDHADNGHRPTLPGGWPRVDAELIGLAAKFEPLVREYYARHVEWARLHTKMHEEMDERFGEGAPIDVWDKANNRSLTEKGRFFEEARDRLGITEICEHRRTEGKSTRCILARQSALCG